MQMLPQIEMCECMCLNIFIPVQVFYVGGLFMLTGSSCVCFACVYICAAPLFQMDLARLWQIDAVY